MEETSDKQNINRIPDEKGRMIFPPWVSWNPKGRPKWQTLKEFAREYLMSLDDNKKLEYLMALDPEIVWKMWEGNPHTTQDHTSWWERIVIPIIPADVLPINNSNSKGTQDVKED